MLTVVILDIFGGAFSQIADAINVDLFAQQGVQANATALPFASESVDEIVVSNPHFSIPTDLTNRSEYGREKVVAYLTEVARVLKPGGVFYLNSNVNNRFGTLPADTILAELGLEVIQKQGKLEAKFIGMNFYRTDGVPVDPETIRTTILRKIKPL